MSLAVLKRKSKTKYDGSLTRNGEFSLKGNRREQSRIGRTQENSVVRPLFIGGDAPNIPRGYGGLPPRSTRSCGTTKCPGSWPQYILCNNGTTSVGGDCNPRSTKNTKGYIESRLLNPTDCEDGKCRPIWVKSFNPLDHSQSMHIRKVKIKTTKCVNNGEPKPPKPTECEPDPYSPDCAKNNTYMLGSRKKSRETHYSNPNDGAISAGEYIDTVLLGNNCLPPPPCKQPFPMILNRNGCVVNYLTPQDAIDDGILPKDWMNCAEGTVATAKTFLINPY